MCSTSNGVLKLVFFLNAVKLEARHKKTILAAGNSIKMTEIVLNSIFRPYFSMY